MFTDFGKDLSLEQLEVACKKQKEIIDKVNLVNYLRRSKEGKDINYFDTFFRVPYGNLVTERTSPPKFETLK